MQLLLSISKRCLIGLTIAVAALIASCANIGTPPSKVERAELERQVAATERAFAKTMADRDLAAFASFVSEEAVFHDGAKPLRGKQSVVDAWKPLYAKPSAPFSWEPREISVLDSGTLALSSGPVRDAAGAEIATFTSIWRLEAPGVWRIIFDKGDAACRCAKP